MGGECHTQLFFDKLIKQLEKGFDGRGMSHTTFFDKLIKQLEKGGDDMDR